jgi:hypothetical protein
VGADVGLHVGKNFLESFSERAYPARIIPLLNEARRLGEKSGAGFYKYDARRRASPDPDLAPLVQQSRKVRAAGCLLVCVCVCVVVVVVCVWGGGGDAGRSRRCLLPVPAQLAQAAPCGMLPPPAATLPPSNWMPPHIGATPPASRCCPRRRRGCTRRARRRPASATATSPSSSSSPS